MLLPNNRINTGAEMLRASRPATTCRRDIGRFVKLNLQRDVVSCVKGRAQRGLPAATKQNPPLRVMQESYEVE